MKQLKSNDKTNSTYKKDLLHLYLRYESYERAFIGTD